jgi:hypothetical protein
MFRLHTSSAPAVDREFTELSGFIRTQCRQIVGLLAERGWLRTPMSRPGELADSLWIPLGENHDALTVRVGQSHQRYMAWLIRALGDLPFR